MLLTRGVVAEIDMDRSLRGLLQYFIIIAVSEQIKGDGNEGGTEPPYS